MAHGNLRLQAALGPVLRITRNEIYDAYSAGLQATLLPGYQSESWGLMGELGYERCSRRTSGTPIGCARSSTTRVTVTTATAPVFMTIAFYTQEDAAKWALVVQTSRGEGPPSARLVAALVLVHGLGYVAASALALRSYAARLGAMHARGLARARLAWLASLVVANGVVWTFALVRHVLALLGRPPAWLGAAVPFGSAAVVFWVGLASLVFPRLLRQAPRVPRPSSRRLDRRRPGSGTTERKE